MVAIQNPPIERTFIPFEYESFDEAALGQLRRERRLDEVVAGARTEWELICRLAAWSSRQWESGHLSQRYPPWNAHEILKLHADGKPVGGFCQRIAQRQNWDWTINGVHLVLEASDTPGELRVCCDTETPGFKAYHARMNGREPQEVASEFEWKLQAGANRLEVWPVNRAERAGVVSHVVLEYNR